MASAIVMPRLSETMTAGKIIKWNKKEGEQVRSGEALAEVETDKATLEMESFEDGTLLKILAPESQSAPVGAPVAIVGNRGEDIASLLGERTTEGAQTGTPAAPSAVSSPTPAAMPSTGRPQMGEGRVRASPLARKMARDRGIDLSQLKGTGPSGRVVAQDVDEMFSRAPRAKPVYRPVTEISPPAIRPVGLPRPEGEIHEFSGMRRIVAARMAQSWREAPHFFLSAEIDMESGLALRQELKELGAQVSINDLVIKAAGTALKQLPQLNRWFQDEQIHQHKEVDVGLAVALPDGLIVPVLRHVDQLTIAQIAQLSRDLVGRARDKRLKPEEYAGGSITVSNLGMYEVDAFMAVLNPPQSMILAIGKVTERPVVRQGELVIRRLMTATLSGDHRAIDGAQGAQYLARVKAALERPVMLMGF